MMIKPIKGVKIMCGFEATNLPATNVQKHVGLQSTQNVDKVARLPENLRADVTNRELQVNGRPCPLNSGLRVI